MRPGNDYRAEVQVLNAEYVVTTDWNSYEATRAKSHLKSYKTRFLNFRLTQRAQILHGFFLDVFVKRFSTTNKAAAQPERESA